MKKILTFLLKFIIILYTCIILNYNSCFADAFKKCTNDEIHKIQDYLNSFRTLSTNFTEDNKGKKSTGKIYIKKPGLMKIEYEQPEKISIFINKDVVSYYDHELDELTKVKNNQRFLSFLSKDTINLHKDFKSFECTNIGDNIYLKLLFDKQNDEEIGVIINFLKYNFNNLMIYVDYKLKNTIKFTEIILNNDMASTQFIFKDKNFFNMEEK
jgi:outer membrane lipoprotein-sorting protein